MSLDHISYSSVEKALQCPRLWYYKYVLKQDLPAGEAASFGKQFDAITAHRLGLGQALGEQPVEGVHDAVDSYLGHPDAWTRADGAQTKVECTPSQWLVLAEEMQANPVLPWPLIGFLDLDRLMDDRLRLETLDLKTSSRAEFRWGWALQGTLYCLFHPKRRGFRWTVHCLVRTKIPKLAIYGPYTPTKRTYRWAMDLVAATCARMKSWTGLGLEEVEAIPGYHCEWCAGRNDCEAAHAGRL